METNKKEILRGLTVTSLWLLFGTIVLVGSIIESTTVSVLISCSIMLIAAVGFTYYLISYINILKTFNKYLDSNYNIKTINDLYLRDLYNKTMSDNIKCNIDYSCNVNCYNRYNTDNIYVVIALNDFNVNIDFYGNKVLLTVNFNENIDFEKIEKLTEDDFCHQICNDGKLFNILFDEEMANDVYIQIGEICNKCIQRIISLLDVYYQKIEKEEEKQHE